MTANVQKILDLFPDKNSARSMRENLGASTRGPAPLSALSDELRNVVGSVVAHQRWRRVWHGDLADYGGDHSAADLALCGELARRGVKPEAIDTAFRASGLYREKWERNDYRASTITLAMKDVRPADDVPTRTLDLGKGIINIHTAEPKPRDWTLAEIILAVKSCVLAGMGGVSKTQLAIQLCLHVAMGIQFMGKAVKQGKALLLLAEEDQEEIDRRINAVVRHKNLSPNEIQRLQDNVRAFGLVGQDTRLTVKVNGALDVSHFGQEIIDRANEMGDVRLIVLDHVALFHGGDFNAREDAAMTMRVVNHIAQVTKASVSLLAHSPKGARNADESDASMVAGSTAFVDQARAALVLAGMREAEAKKYGIGAEDRGNYVSLMVAKNNYGPTGEVYWFERVPFDGVGLLEHVILTPPAPAARGSAVTETMVRDFIAQHRGQFTKTGLRDTHGGKDGPFKASKGSVAAALETLLADGRLIARPPSDRERKKFDLGPRVQNVLDVGAVQ
jgi:hypothetical protein